MSIFPVHQTLAVREINIVLVDLKVVTNVFCKGFPNETAVGARSSLQAIWKVVPNEYSPSDNNKSGQMFVVSHW